MRAKERKKEGKTIPNITKNCKKKRTMFLIMIITIANLIDTK